MRNISILSSLLLALAIGACKKKEEKKPEATTPPTEAPTKDAMAAEPPAEPAPASAEATMAPASDSKVAGTVLFTVAGDKVMVSAKLSGLTPGDHGFHVHETGDCSAPDATSAGGHFNPAGVDHGAPDSPAHHSGDLGNITAGEDGNAEMSAELPTSFLSLDPKAPNNIVGRAVVVHAGADDLKTQPSGNAGARVGCGVIKAAADGGAATEEAAEDAPTEAAEDDSAE